LALPSIIDGGLGVATPRRREAWPDTSLS